MTEPENSYHVQVLRSELARRKAKNPSYSLRAFAKHLEMDPSALSRVLRAKQELSVRGSLSIVQKVGFNEDEKKLFLTSVAGTKFQKISGLLSDCLLGDSLRAPAIGYSGAMPRLCETVAAAL